MPEPSSTYRYWGNKQPSPSEITASVEGKTAVMRIYDPIDEAGAPWGISSKDFAGALEALPADTDRIELHIHSPGGDAFAGLAILNQLRQHPAKIDVIVDGLAASAASYIAMAGDTLSMSPNSELAIHDASGICLGQPVDMQTMFTRLDKLSQNIAEIYADKAGGTADEWRAAMQPESWYTAQEAVDAGLADRVLPKNTTDSEPQARFDLAIFNHAGRADAPPPFIPTDRTPAPPDNQPKEADAMSDTTKELRERLSLPEDADEAAVLAAVDELKTKAEAEPEPAEVTDEAIATARNLTPEQVKAALDAATQEKVPVSQAYLDTIEGDAKAGREARQKQLDDERDATIKAAIDDGKLSRDNETRKRWTDAWNADPAGTKADLDKLGARFPVGPTSGYAGDDGTTGAGAAFSEDEAAEMATLTGTPKEAWA